MRIFFFQTEDGIRCLTVTGVQTCALPILLAFFKTGAAHIGKSGRASMSRSVDGGETWSQPETVFDRPDADDAVIATGVLSDGAILAAAVSYTWTGERYSFEGWHASMWLIHS